MLCLQWLLKCQWQKAWNVIKATWVKWKKKTVVIMQHIVQIWQVSIFDLKNKFLISKRFEPLSSQCGTCEHLTVKVYDWTKNLNTHFEKDWVCKFHSIACFNLFSGADSKETDYWCELWPDSDSQKKEMEEKHNIDFSKGGCTKVFHKLLAGNVSYCFCPKDLCNCNGDQCKITESDSNSLNVEICLFAIVLFPIINEYVIGF